MPILLPATGVGITVTGGVSDNSIEFTKVSDAYLGTPDKPGVNTEMASAVAAMATCAVTANTLATRMALFASTLAAVSTQINLSNKLGAVGVQGTGDNFNYNANLNVITARNLLSGPTDKITLPPPPPGII